MAKAAPAKKASPAKVANLAHALDELDVRQEKTAIEDVLGKRIVITDWKLRPSSYKASGDKLDDESEESGDRDYVTLTFYFENDKKQEERFLNTGAFQIVTVVRNGIESGYALPTATVINAKRTPKGRTYEFARA